MQIIQEQFFVNYTIQDGIIKSSASGNFQGNNYDSSVRITCSNRYEVLNEKTDNIDETEQRVVFKIPCPDNKIAGEVAKAIRTILREKKQSLSFVGGFPNDNLVVNVSTPYDTFLLNPTPILVTEFEADKNDLKGKNEVKKDK
ncbi:hypothetical protein LMG7974_00211 [Campylobacter majalis]|uniref:Periplasmic protein n=1 Tax=Campylobacter majalis TaxID=2790656 RepID=A0ABM8Q361_9BACT|nr:hypothetical protein [Campylobacter majalis]CAD7287272.1 hypothetical protein LMG7974_00211 [Campylobacter majalis]